MTAFTGHLFRHNVAMHGVHKRSGSKTAATRQLDGRGRRVLIADTDPAVSIDLAKALRQVKFTVDCAEDRATRLKMLASEDAYDVIILDLLLTGYEFFDHVKKRYPERQPHIILITSAPRRNIARIRRTPTRRPLFAVGRRGR